MISRPYFNAEIGWSRWTFSDVQGAVAIGVGQAAREKCEAGDVLGRRPRRMRRVGGEIEVDIDRACCGGNIGSELVDDGPGVLRFERGGGSIRRQLRATIRNGDGDLVESPSKVSDFAGQDLLRAFAAVHGALGFVAGDCFEAYACRQDDFSRAAAGQRCKADVRGRRLRIVAQAAERERQ